MGDSTKDVDFLTLPLSLELGLLGEMTYMSTQNIEIFFKKSFLMYTFLSQFNISEFWIHLTIYGIYNYNCLNDIWHNVSHNWWHLSFDEFSNTFYKQDWCQELWAFGISSITVATSPRGFWEMKRGESPLWHAVLQSPHRTLKTSEGKE